MNTLELAKTLINATDEEFAEVFAYLNRFHKSNGIIRDENRLTKDEMSLDTYELSRWIEDSLREIIYSEEIDSSAWWKDDEFFGKNTPKAKFNAQTTEFQSRRLMETAMTMNNIYTRMVKTGEIYDGGIKADVYDVLCSLAREFEETFFETDEYEDDYISVIEKWLQERLKEEFGAQEVSA